MQNESRMLSLTEYLRIAEALVGKHNAVYRYDEDCISAVAEGMMVADSKNKAVEDWKRKAYRYRGGKMALIKYVKFNYQRRYINTRPKRKEILNHCQYVQLDGLSSESSSCPTENNEVYNYILSLENCIREPLIRFYIMGETRKDIRKSMGIGRDKLNSLLLEGISRVREKFQDNSDDK